MPGPQTKPRQPEAQDCIKYQNQPQKTGKPESDFQSQFEVSLRPWRRSDAVIRFIQMHRNYQVEGTLT